MRFALLGLVSLGAGAACSGSHSASTPNAGSGSTSGATSGSAAGATSGSTTPVSGTTSGGSGTSASGSGSSVASGSGSSVASGSTASGTSMSSSGASAGASGGSAGASGGADAGGAFPPAGNAAGTCTTLTLPNAAALVDTSTPTTLVGNGDPASCTFAALNGAVTRGGIVTFNCGPTPVTIAVTATLTPPTSNAYAKQPSVVTVIDGGNKVTLDGGGAVRILSWVHMGSWRLNQDTLTLQRIRLVNGKATPTQQIPACPASGSIANTECSTGYDDGQGGALLVQDGSVRVIDSIFDSNQAALLGPDTGGGAIYLYGTGSPAYIVRSSFLNNTASNAGGVGMLWAGAVIVDSLFQGNRAVGTGANSVDATKCTCANMGNKNQVGSGGNGGAIYKDGGDAANLTICGTLIKGNSAKEFGPAVFLTADGSAAKLIIDESSLTENTAGNPVWHWCAGVSTDNPHMTGSATCSPPPQQTTFCDATGANCTMACGS